MLKDISWTNYGIFILITLVVYYVTVAILYYFNEIKQLSSGKFNLFLRLSKSKKFIAGQNSLLAINSGAKDDLQHIVSDYMDQIKSALKQAADKNLIKEEIIYSLQLLADKYSVIKNSPFKSFITDYILIECNNYCSIHLDAEDLNRIWVL